ncbi:MAG: hypothetical protein HKL87_04895 [Acidimicrobiaceae bacterium]|jgi:hypothetical protein|nr:hypothetical protein [Acidimicrobiaceae bacterium]
MAVRVFEWSHDEPVVLKVVAPTRRDLRRARQRYAVIAVTVLGLPFVLAVVVAGVVH